MIRFVTIAVFITCCITYESDCSPAAQDVARNRIRRIANGKDTSILDYPYLVQIFCSGSLMCGGSILNTEWVLTAAQCVSIEDKPEKYLIYSGSTYLRSHFRHKVETFIKHEKYDPENNWDSQPYDIAVIKVKRLFRYSLAVKPVQLPEAGSLLTDSTTLNIVGHGKTTKGTDFSDVIQETSVFVIPLEECNSTWWSSVAPIHESQLCIFNEKEKKEFCSGDTGGPALINDTIVGILSTYERPCGDKDIPQLCTNVAYFVNWIKEKTGL